MAHEALYDALNQKYFGGHLPRVKVKMANLSKQWCLGWYHKSKWKREIILSQTLTGEGLRRTLLHEMIHVMIDVISPAYFSRAARNGLDHDSIFRQKLHRLVLMGEAWALEQIEDYKEFEKDKFFAGYIKKPWKRHVAGMIDNIAMLNTNAEWIKVRRYLARDCQISQREFLKLAPWSKGYWQHQVSKQKRYKAIKERNLEKSESSSRERS